MPPHKPGRLSTFLGKLTRNIALNRYLHDHAEKRYAPTELVLHEVEEILPDPVSEDTADEIVLKDAINGFLASLPQQTRIIFVRRYWYLSSVKEIARDLGVKESSVKVILHRTRNQFKEYLEKEGIYV
jgi:RNA polymerase sigma-70 factor (ECF subfamily)